MDSFLQFVNDNREYIVYVILGLLILVALRPIKSPAPARENQGDPLRHQWESNFPEDPPSER